MPLTPFHFRPGALVKSVVPKYFSFTLFVLVQVFIDIEALYYIFKNDFPLHRFFHTYIGATLIIVVAVLIGKPVCQRGLKLIGLPGKISLKCAVITSVIAAYSHVLLDSIMHSDVMPFLPLSDKNPMLNIIDVGLLHVICIASGIIGAVALSVIYFLKREKA